MIYPREPTARTALIILARYPTLGQVKTRLARTLGDQFALDFYDACSRYVIGELAELPPRVKKYLYVSNAEDLPRMRSRHGTRVEHRSQRGGCFGARMQNAFQDAFAAGAQQCLVVATDTPDLDRHVVMRALRALETSDAVLGPAEDGGYYLLGIKALHPSLFFDMPWSTEAVGAITRRRMRRLGWRFDLLEPLPDIDDESDLMAWMAGPLGRRHDLREGIEAALHRSQAS